MNAPHADPPVRVLENVDALLNDARRQACAAWASFGLACAGFREPDESEADPASCERTGNNELREALRSLDAAQSELERLAARLRDQKASL